jgi:hypothetical protein
MSSRAAWVAAVLVSASLHRSGDGNSVLRPPLRLDKEALQYICFFSGPLTFVVAEFLSPQLFPHYLAASQYIASTPHPISDITGILGVTAIIVIGTLRSTLRSEDG